MGRRGSKRGVKRGPYKKHKVRRYPTRRKTTTKEGKKEYQRWYMRVKLAIPPSRFGVLGRKPKAITLKDLKLDLRKLDPRFKRRKK